MNSKRVILAGGSGFIGTALAHAFVERGYEVIVLSRQPKVRADKIEEVAWDGRTAGAWAQWLDGATAVINLTGKNINCRHTPENLREITASRVDAVNAIAQALGKIKAPPSVWVQASAIGFYGDAGDRVCDETAPGGNDVLARVCREWEGAFDAVKTPGTRRVVMRIGFVLGRDGGGFPMLAGLTRKFLGGAAGNGRQYVSWVHLADLVRMFVAAVEQNALNGTFNVVAPNPVTNSDFMKELRGALHRPWSPPVPAFAIKMGASLMGTEASLILASQRCVPRHFLDSGFEFEFPELRQALADLCSR